MRRNFKSQNGFTLVELAISIMIIGLLLGGILKGRELIDNARVNQTVAQVKSYQAAVGTFRSTYGSWPGDMRMAGSRLPNCTVTLCTNSGNGDQRLAGGSNVSVGFSYAMANYLIYTGANESLSFWMHLLKAGLITGIDENGTTSPTPGEFGYNMPAAPFEDTGFWAGWNDYTAAPYTTNAQRNTMVIATTDSTSHALSGSQASQIDRKMDDGKPFTGEVLTDNAGGCNTTAAVTSDYKESSKITHCDVSFFF